MTPDDAAALAAVPAYWLDELIRIQTDHNATDDTVAIGRAAIDHYIASGPLPVSVCPPPPMPGEAV